MRQVFFFLPSIILLSIVGLPLSGDALTAHIALTSMLLSGMVWVAFRYSRKSGEAKFSYTQKERALIAVMGLAYISYVVSALTSLRPLASFIGIHGTDVLSVSFIGLLLLYTVVALGAFSENDRNKTVYYTGIATIGLVIADIVSLLVTGNQILSESPMVFGMFLVSLPLFATHIADSHIRFRSIVVVFWCFIALVGLLLLDSTFAWVAMLAVGFWLATQSHYRFGAVLLGAISAVFALFSSPIGRVIESNIYPSLSLTTDIASNALTSVRAMFGYGQGTFEIVYAMFRPEYIASTVLSRELFQHSVSGALELLVSVGIVGALCISIAVLIALFGAISSKRMAGAVLLIIVVAFFIVSPLSVPHVILLVVALIWIFAEQEKNHVYRLSRANIRAVAVALSIVLVATLTVLFARGASEIKYAKVVSLQSVHSIDETVRGIDLATSWFPFDDIMYRNLSYVLLLAGSQEVEKTQRDDTRIARLLGLAVDAGERSVRLNKHHPENRRYLGDVYNELSAVDIQANALAIDAYSEAIELAPTFAHYHMELGKLYLRRVNALNTVDQTEEMTMERERSLQLAEEYLIEAERLHPELEGLAFYLAQLALANGDSQKAITELEYLQSIDPSNIESTLRLAILYLENQQLEDAERLLIGVLNRDPLHSNARWYLATVYETQNRLDVALEQLSIIQKSNPNNVDLSERIERIKGRVTTLGPELPEPLVE